MDKVGMDKAVAARTDVEALATAEEALIEGTVKDGQPTKKRTASICSSYNPNNCCNWYVLQPVKFVSTASP